MNSTYTSASVGKSQINIKELQEQIKDIGQIKNITLVIDKTFYNNNKEELRDYLSHAACNVVFRDLPKGIQAYWMEGNYQWI